MQSRMLATRHSYTWELGMSTSVNYFSARAMYFFFHIAGSFFSGLPVLRFTRLCARTVQAKRVSRVFRSLAPNLVISRIALNPLQHPAQGRMY
ncbi:hypothetical protein MT325_m671L [Paramecium bursaria chlorella virus MT325]|uniref:Uncharacterized protein m671L n=1 Tax=Paramecium bursaria Chlorella virus MT325 TaxID=346932 RepID=A7IV51_PBCVM|nr:hypothetical protein MT325_m671L [Paramecium bursaria chlorella virus MT325]